MLSRRGVLGGLLSVAGGAWLGGHEAAAKEFPRLVPRPKMRFTTRQVLTAEQLNQIVERIEALEEVLLRR